MVTDAIVRALPKKFLLALFLPLAYLTSPKASLYHMYQVLCKVPYYILKRLLENLMPQLFMKSVANDTVLITGAASGIGKLLATKFARLGAKVALLDMNAKAVEQAAGEVAKEAEAKGHKADRIAHFVGDLSDRENTYEAIEKVKQQCGDVTILVNNAGIVTGKKLLDASDKAIDMTMRVNTDAHFWTLKACLPSMLENNRGHVVSMASSAGLGGIAGLIDYCASKWGACGTMEALRGEIRKVGKTGVKTTCVCPYYIKTGMFTGAKSKWPKLMPMLEPEDVAERIMQAVRCDQELLVMPLAINLVFLAKLLPVPVYDAIQELVGINDSMDEFKGRGGVQ